MLPEESTPDRKDDGATPLTEDETDGLIPPHLSTRAELNQWEATNIASANSWIGSRVPTVLDVAFLKELHRRMFDETWEWAGEFRRSDKNISPYHWTEMPRLIHDLIANTQVRYEHSAKTDEALDGLAARFHFELVRIHPWPNGNGRHSRLMTDLLLRSWARPEFSWGSVAHQTNRGPIRAQYIAALKAADAGNFDALIQFVRT